MMRAQALIEQLFLPQFADRDVGIEFKSVE
jgi:hypothetical protein